MNLLVCIDDTDNLESPGSGHLASQLVDIIEAKGWGLCSFVTRHQLLVHPDIPYTSHNSAMCFGVTLKAPHYLAELITRAGDFLAKVAASGSDPGLCVAFLEQVVDHQALMAFGQSAKKEVLNKAAAYALAKKLNIHLSEHGGTGQGVVGALAGAGLRLGGNDGRLKGQLHFETPGEVVSVAQLLEHSLVDRVSGLNGQRPQAGEQVELGEKIKTVMQGGESVLMIEPNPAGPVPWRTCSRKQLRDF